MGMPPASVDPDRLRTLGAALGPLRECAREGAEEVLAQFPELGDRETQATLDGWVEQVADLLREIDATGSDVADRLRVAALNAAVPQAQVSSSDERAAGVTAHSEWSSDASGEAFR